MHPKRYQYMYFRYAGGSCYTTTRTSTGIYSCACIGVIRWFKRAVERVSITAVQAVSTTPTVDQCISTTVQIHARLTLKPFLHCSDKHSELITTAVFISSHYTYVQHRNDYYFTWRDKEGALERH